LVNAVLKNMKGVLNKLDKLKQSKK
jgi:hypothetical protein